MARTHPLSFRQHIQAWFCESFLQTKTSDTMRPDQVEQLQKLVGFDMALALADRSDCFAFHNCVRQDEAHEEPAASSIQKSLDDTRLQLENVTADYLSLQESMETVKKTTEEVMAGLHRELSESWAAAQHAHELKATESDSSGQVIDDLQEQLSQLRSDKATDEQALRATSLEVDAEQGRTTVAQAEAASFKAKTTELEREVGCLKQSLSTAEETMKITFQVHEEEVQGLQSQLCKLETQKVTDDTAMRTLEVDLESACTHATLTEKKASTMQEQSAGLEKQCSQLQQELSSMRDVVADAKASNTKALQEGRMESAKLQALLAEQSAATNHANQTLADLHHLHAKSQMNATRRSVQLLKQLDQKVNELGSASQQMTEMQKEIQSAHFVRDADLDALWEKVKLLQGDYDAHLQRIKTESHQELALKQHAVLAVNQELATLQKTHEATVKEAQTGSAELQKQLARKDDDLSSIKEELAHLQQELKHAVGGKHEAAQSSIPQLVDSSTGSDGFVEPEVTAIPSPPKLDLPFLPPGLAKLRSPSEGNVTSGDGLLEPEVTATPPGLKPNPVANAGLRTGQLMSFDQAYCHHSSKLPGVREVAVNVLRIAQDLAKLHSEGLVHQAVHQKYVQVSQSGVWELAGVKQAAPMNSSLDLSMVVPGVEAPEMAKHLLSAGYYFPQPAHDMYGLGLLLFCACGGHLPKGHLDAISNGSTQRHASKLCGSGHSTAYLGQLELAMKQARLSKALSAVVLGCLEREPTQRHTAKFVIAALKNLIRQKGW